MNQPHISPRYCDETPSAQTALDIFRGSWKSALPLEFNLETGSAELFFVDPRVYWAEQLLPTGFRGLDILELGPFESYDTYLFDKMGAANITSIEGNNINYLKCLVLKDVLKLKANLLFGDFRGYLRNSTHRFDLIWASGVLYHSEDPIDLLSLVTSRTDKLFIWTHYITPEFLKSGYATLFPADGIIKKCYGDVSYTLHKRVYFLEEGPRALPLHWEGGTRLHAYWMERDDILGFLCNVGLTRITIQDEGALDGMPYIGLLAERPNT
jgi:hypothetical protein